MNQANRLSIRLGKIQTAEVSPDDLFSTIDLSRFYFPVRGVIASLVIHFITAYIFYLIPLLQTYLTPVPPPERVVFIDLTSPRTVMYLPPLQGTEPAAEAQESKRGSEKKSPVQPAGNEGLSYPGLQPILSDVPEPTNSIQTILQPDVEKPKILVPPLPIPNIVQTEKTPMVVQSPPEPAIDPEMVLPDLESAPPERMRSKNPVRPAEDPALEAPEPSDDLLSMQIPDLVRTEAEPEMTLPDLESAPPERMRPKNPVRPQENPAMEATGPSDDLLSMQIPDLIRTEAEPEMTLPDLESAPPERMRSKNPVRPEENPAMEATGPSDDLLSMQIPDLIRTEAEPEMTLPDLESAPPERMRPKNPVRPEENPAMEATGPSDDLLSMQIPDLIRTEDEPEMPLPEPESAPLERIKTSSRTFVDRKYPAAAITPSTENAPAQIPDLIKATPPAEAEPFLSLSPMPALPAMKVEIPAGEARGEFAISPEPNLDASASKPGIKLKAPVEKAPPGSNIPESMAPGTGTRPGAAVIDLDAADSAGDKTESSPMDVEIITGQGDNSFEGITVIRGTEKIGDNSGFTILGPDSGQGDGFTIIENDAAAGGEPQPLPPAKKPRPLQTSYSLSIISTENSGGGLPSDGVFNTDQIYTVYLDMRQTELEQDRSWILEFSLLEETEDNPIISLDEENSSGGLILPFPSTKKRPEFPRELVKNYLDGMILVSGIIDTRGRIGKLTVQDSPDASLGRELLAALGQWIFRPGLLNGKPVAVKVLIGVPLWLPDGKLN